MPAWVTTENHFEVTFLTDHWSLLSTGTLFTDIGYRWVGRYLGKYISMLSMKLSIEVQTFYQLNMDLQIPIYLKVGRYLLLKLRHPLVNVSNTLLSRNMQITANAISSFSFCQWRHLLICRYINFNPISKQISCLLMIYDEPKVYFWFYVLLFSIVLYLCTV